MSFRVVEKKSLPTSSSPYRLVDDQGHEIPWANEFLDAQKLRLLSLRSIRAYALDLLHTTRWFQSQCHSQPSQLNMAGGSAALKETPSLHVAPDNA